MNRASVLDASIFAASAATRIANTNFPARWSARAYPMRTFNPRGASFKWASNMGSTAAAVLATDFDSSSAASVKWCNGRCDLTESRATRSPAADRCERFANPSNLM